jgi:DNA-binding NarL/FixJ family response regulator
LADDQALIRSAVRRALSRAGIRVVGEADDADSCVKAVLDLRPDVVLTDFVFHGTARIDVIEQISLLAPESRILVLTSSTDRECLLEAIVAGACGYILKDAALSEIVGGVRASAAGGCVISPDIAGALLTRIRERDIRLTARSRDSAEAIRAILTERELAIFKRLANGEKNREIAETFSLSENTVKNHIASILAKLHLHNRAHAAAQAVRSGLSCATGLLVMQALLDETNLAGCVTSFLLGG